MSAISLILLLAAAVATALGGAALHTVRGLHRRLTELRVQLAAVEARGALARAAVPAARTSPDADEIRSAVADALAEERERELAEARAFWAAQEARDACADHVLLEGRGTEYEGTRLDPSLLDALLERALGGPHEGELFVPRRSDRDAPRPVSPQGPAEAGAPDAAEETTADTTDDTTEEAPADTARGPRDTGAEPPELAAARRRPPSQPDYDLRGEPVVPAQPPGDHEETHRRLAELADARVPLSDVRPGPLGTLDVYVFADGTTVCMTPGHRETAERLAAALRAGIAPVLLGGSGVSGAYALTFECGRESVYVLADRIIASI